MQEDFQAGDLVRLRNSPGQIGNVSQIRTTATGAVLAVVNFPTATRNVPVSQLEHAPSIPETTAQLIRNGHLSSVEGLRRQLSHVRLSGNMADIFYSMENSDTDFYAHQFKPVVKILESPTGNLLIADEVGLGKTIEAGLIWIELAARFKYNRLLVVCPKVLCDKWRLELASKFGIDARICDARELVDYLSGTYAQRSGFAVICGMQSIRPRPKAKRTHRSVDKLAALLEEAQGGDRLADLLIIDEAHHMRNPGTQTNYLGQLLCAVAEHTVMLSATPINLHNRDLQSLLRLIDDLTFRDEAALEQIIRANQPLVAARDAALAGCSVDDLFQLLTTASRAPILKEARSLKQLLSELRLETTLLPRKRAEIARRLERVNLLSNVINRTRRRDVEEFRVHRDVTAYRAQMTPEEHRVYDEITRGILKYAYENDLPTGFLTVMPQRMLASSIPAALAHWGHSELSDDFEDEDDFENDSDDTADRIAPKERRPLMQMLSRIVRSMPSAREMAGHDSKFIEFLRVMRDRIEAAPDEKFVVFSTFRGTLAYLGNRLKDAGIATLSMHGATLNRTELVDQFRTSTSVQVLLASEVGSEGIDLQFARTVVNYDLPWNPMRVEQRIGRVDRLGQEAASISVLNLMHAKTVDERIYHRLHERLGLCKKALGGFEEILGRDIAILTKDILSGRMSDQEEQRRLDQTEQAIANMREEEEALEGQAAALFAHGDYVVQSIRESRREGHWLTERDIVEYVDATLTLLFPGSEVHWQMADGLLNVRLSQDGRFEFTNWCERNRLGASPLDRQGGPATFKVGKTAKGKRHPRLGPTHPLIRFLSSRLEEREGLKAHAAALYLEAEFAQGLAPGIYVGAIEEWVFGRGATSTIIGFSLASLAEGDLIDAELAERVVGACLLNAGLWQTAIEEADLDLAAGRVEETLEADLADRFVRERDRREAEILDRIALQKASLAEHARQQRLNFDRIIAQGGRQLEAANRARLSRVEEGISLREKRIQAQAVSDPSSRAIGSFLLKVIP